ncbi:hypothetical protein THAOC_03937 [Thalassiosira oceanica]|uniref:Uncharacterized protein n=1 Tax=Thalassiosira oceanica TaxID=159749 RepID=K0TB70_THAOC|nr:hypothetical protein THAOC_03937 [Thalassiosira oceanica]|eukprot:EJK74384.1 hypothetical protein THAOC_03937 [Thalassiosira oceanica]
MQGRAARDEVRHDHGGSGDGSEGVMYESEGGRRRERERERTKRKQTGTAEEKGKGPPRIREWGSGYKLFSVTTSRYCAEVVPRPTRGPSRMNSASCGGSKLFCFWELYNLAYCNGFKEGLVLCINAEAR